MLGEKRQLTIKLGCGYLRVDVKNYRSNTVTSPGPGYSPSHAL